MLAFLFFLLPYWMPQQQSRLPSRIQMSSVNRGNDEILSSNFQHTTGGSIPQQSRSVIGNAIKTDEMRFDTQQEVDNFIRTQLSECDNRNIADLMRISAKVARNNGKRTFLRPHFPAIANRLEELSSVDWKFNDISFVVYGLQYSIEKEIGVLDIISIMAKIGSISIKNIK